MLRQELRLVARSGVIFATAALSVLAGANPSVADDAQTYVSDAQARIAAGDLKGAEIQLRNAVREHPDDAAIHSKLAELYLKLDNLPAAEAEARLARQDHGSADDVDPVLAEALARQNKVTQLLELVKPADRRPKQESRVRLQLGLAHFVLHENAEAEPLLRDAVNLDEDAADPKIAIARLLISKHEYDDAEAELARAQQIAPDDPAPMQLRGEILFDKGDVPGALKQFEAVLEKHPNHLPTLFAHANVSMTTGKLDDAQRDIELALKIDPRNLVGNYLSAMLSAKRGDLKAADDRLTSISPNFSTFPEGYYLQGAVQFSLGEDEQAASNLGKYLARNPSFLPARRLIAMLAARKRQWTRVIDTLKPVIDANTSDPQSVGLLAQAYQMTGNRDKALQLFQTAMQENADNSAVMTQFALVQMQLGDTKGGVTQLEALAANEKSAEIAGPVLVMTKLRSGQVTAAAEEAEALLKRNPKDVLAQDLLGVARMAQRNYAEAAAIFEVIFQRDHNLVQVQRNLAKAYQSQGRIEDAKKIWSAILESKPGDAEALISLAGIASQAKDYDKAHELLKKAQEGAPQDTAPGILQVQLFAEQKDWSKALQAVRDLEGQFPANPTIITLAAQVRTASGDLKGAVSELQQGVQAFPGSAPAYLALTQAQLRAGDKSGALATLDKAVTVAPGNLAVIGAFVDLLYDERGIDAARDAVRKLTRAQPGIGAIMQANLLLRTKDRAGAIALLSQEQQQRPNARVATRLAQFMYLDGKPKDAEAILSAWLKDHGGDLDVRRELANMELVERQFDDAARDYEQVLAGAPLDPISLNNLAWIYDKKGDPRALSLAEQGYNLAPTSERGDTIGWILVEHGNSQRALPYLQQAATTAPQNPSIQYHYAVALKATGSKDQARDVLERIVKSEVRFDDRSNAQRLLAELQNG